MAALRPVEERDAKDRTVRVNPTVCFKQDRQIRVIVGRHDWRLEPNPQYHEPITAQVQDGRIVFFSGVPDTAQTRKAAREMTLAEVQEVAPYIVKELQTHPIKVKEARPAVYEVKLATIGGVETTEVAEMESDGQSVVVTPIEPDLTEKALRRMRAAGIAPSV